MFILDRQIIQAGHAELGEFWNQNPFDFAKQEQFLSSTQDLLEEVQRDSVNRRHEVLPLYAEEVVDVLFAFDNSVQICHQNLGRIPLKLWHDRDLLLESLCSGRRRVPDLIRWWIIADLKANAVFKAYSFHIY